MQSLSNRLLSVLVIFDPGTLGLPGALDLLECPNSMRKTVFIIRFTVVRTDAILRRELVLLALLSVDSTSCVSSLVSITPMFT